MIGEIDQEEDSHIIIYHINRYLRERERERERARERERERIRNTHTHNMKHVVKQWKKTHPQVIIFLGCMHTVASNGSSSGLLPGAYGDPSMEVGPFFVGETKPSESWWNATKATWSELGWLWLVAPSWFSRFSRWIVLPQGASSFFASCGLPNSPSPPAAGILGAAQFEEKHWRLLDHRIHNPSQASPWCFQIGFELVQLRF